MGRYEYIYNGQRYTRQELSRYFGKDAATFEYRMRRHGLTFQQAVDDWDKHTLCNRDNALTDYRPVVPETAARVGDLQGVLQKVAAFCRECAYWNTRKHKCKMTDCHLYGLAAMQKEDTNG